MKMEDPAMEKELLAMTLRGCKSSKIQPNQVTEIRQVLRKCRLEPVDYREKRQVERILRSANAT